MILFFIYINMENEVKLLLDIFNILKTNEFNEELVLNVENIR